MRSSGPFRFVPRFLLPAVGLWLAVATPLAHAGTVSADPPNLAFGNVHINHKATLPVVLTNTGKSRVTITKDQVRGKWFSVDLTVPVTLKAGQKLTVHVNFAPQADGFDSGNVSVSNWNGLVVKIRVSGNATQSGHSVGLSWHPSPSKDIVGYNIYRATRSRGPYEKINSDLDTATSYLDDTVLSGRTYYYVTTAVDSDAQESKHSNRVKAIIP